MIWSRWVEDIVYSLYYKYDIAGQKEQQARLKTICMNELNSYKEIKNNIKDQKQLEYFIIQMALENM